MGGDRCRSPVRILTAFTRHQGVTLPIGFKIGCKTLGPREKEIFWKLPLLILFLIPKEEKNIFFSKKNALVNLNGRGENLGERVKCVTKEAFWNKAEPQRWLCTPQGLDCGVGAAERCRR